MIKRREFITLLGGAAVTWPFAARAQQAKKPVIGFLDRGSPAAMTANVAGFHKGLAENGYIEGKNISVEYRWAGNQIERLPALAAELVRLPVSVIAATRTSAPAMAAKAATSTIPIVFQTGSDPVKDGLVASFNRPGGNVTGAARISAELVQKRLSMILQVVPGATTIALLANPNNDVGFATQVPEMQAAARERGVSLYVAKASNERELDAVFASIAQAGVGALVEGNDTLFLDRRKQLVALTISHRIPTIFFEREAVTDGGLMSYDASLVDSFRQVGIYVGRILKGDKPADLPVLQPTKFDLIINVTTARAIGLEIPPIAAASGVECHVDRKTIIKHRDHQRIMPKMVTVTAASKRLVGTAQLARRRRRSPPGSDVIALARPEVSQEGKSHETAGIHHAARRCGCVSARGARANDAGDDLSHACAVAERAAVLRHGVGIDPELLANGIGA